MMLSLLIAVPLLGALVVALLPRSADGRTARYVAVGVSILTLVMSPLLLREFDLEVGGYQLAEQHEWIGAFGVHWALGVNGIGLTMIFLTTVLTPIVLAASWNDKADDPGRTNAYFAWLLALEALAIGVFAATDVFVFYVLFEATLIPLYFLIGGHGTGRRSYAAVKFLIYNLLGGLLMLASIVGLYVLSTQQGGPSFLRADLAGLDMSATTERLLFLGFFIAFAIKAPMWPLHTWLPDAAASATPGTNVMMVSVIDKLGTFGMIIWCLELFPSASEWAAPVVLVLAVVSILYGALLAIGQADLRRLVAMTSVSHFGFIILGVFAFTSTSMAGSVLYMFNHGLTTALLFLVVGMMIARRGSGLIADYGGVQKVAPVLSGVLLLAGLASLSLPGLAPFVSEFLVLVGTFSRSIPLAAAATVGMVLAAVYILLMFQRTMTGPLNERTSTFRDLSPREVGALAPAIVLIIGLGFVPQPLLSVIDPAVDPVIATVGEGDPPQRAPLDLTQQTEGDHE